eukprot:COSAG02_NODE_15313_length_1182_cov_1.264081_1_plen_378_part_01
MREAKEFVRSQGRARARAQGKTARKAKPAKPAHRRVDQRVFDQRANGRAVPKHAPRREPAKSKAQKAREAEAELRQLRNGDTSSLMSEGSSLWDASDYSGFGFARGRAIGRVPSTTDSGYSGGGAANRYSDSDAGAENDPSAIWSDASSSDTPHSFATTDSSGVLNGADPHLVSTVESVWKDDLHRHEGEMGQDYHEQSTASEAYARPSVPEPAAMPATRSGFRMRHAGMPTGSVVEKEDRQRKDKAPLAQRMSTSPPPSPGTLTRLESVVREKHLALSFRVFNFWLEWVAAASRCSTARMATAALHDRTTRLRRRFNYWREQTTGADAQGYGLATGDESALSAAVSSVSDPHGQDAAGGNSIQRLMVVEQPPCLACN